MTQHADEVQTRIEKVERMKALGIIPYAASFDKKNPIDSLASFDTTVFREIETIIASPKNNVKTAERVTLFRSFGKISFAKIQDATGEIQIMFSRENYSIVTPEGIKTQLSEEVTGIDIAKYEPGDEEIFRKILERQKIVIEGMEKMGLFRGL